MKKDVYWIVLDGDTIYYLNKESAIEAFKLITNYMKHRKKNRCVLYELKDVIFSDWLLMTLLNNTFTHYYLGGYANAKLLGVVDFREKQNVLP